MLRDLLDLHARRHHQQQARREFLIFDNDEAAAMLEAAESEYERHSRAARTLTEEHFDARKVLARVLEQALP